jgi:hypothetical protein
MFGDLFGKIVAAPFRIANLPFKIIESISDMPHQDDLGLDEAAKTVEKSVKEIFDTKE